MIPLSEICSDCRNRVHEMPHVEKCACPCHQRPFETDAAGFPFVTDGTAGASPASTGEAPDSLEEELVRLENNYLHSLVEGCAAHIEHWKRVSLLFGLLWAGTLLAWWVWAVWR